MMTAATPGVPVRRKHLRKPGAYVLIAIEWLVALAFIAPLLWVLLNSLKSNMEIIYTPFWFGATLRFKNYVNVWNGGIGRAFLNSTIVVFGALPLSLGASCMASYVLARVPFRGRTLLVYFFLGGLMVPTLLGIIPLFVFLNKLGLFNSYVGLILVYGTYMLPFNIYLMLPFFRGIPRELEEAAQIDGCSLLQMFRLIVLPLTWPVIGAAAIFNFVTCWTEYVYALVFTSDMRTLPVQVVNVMDRLRVQSDYGQLFAALVIATIPTIVVLRLFERRMVKTVRFGGIKG